MRIKLLAILAVMAVSVMGAAQSFDAKAIFKQKCAMCHGADGKTPTLIGKNLGSPDLTSDKVKKASDKELTEAITKGKGKMPAFGPSLGGDKNVAEMVKYVRALK